VRCISDKKTDKCEICGKGLVYIKNIENNPKMKCNFCGKLEQPNTFCPEGHYICDICHGKDAIEIIDIYCEDTDIKDPFKLADRIMTHPKFKMYGPEHHVLTPAVILTTLKNNNIKKPNGKEITLFDIKEAIRRASKIPGGWCGFYGTCGAGIGSGVAISLFTGATPSTDGPRTLSNQMTSRALNRIADNLEHCCKRSVKLSIIEILVFLNEKFEINLNFKPEKCAFSEANKLCAKTECPIY